MKPVAAISGTGNLALAVVYNTTLESPVTFLMHDIHVWVDNPLLSRLQRLVAILSASRIHQELSSESPASASSLSLQVFVSSCFISYSELSNTAATLAIAPGATLDRLFAEIDKPSFLAGAAPLLSVRGNSAAIVAKQAQVLHVRKSPSAQEFDFADVGRANDLQISLVLNSTVDVQDFCHALPIALAPTSAFSPFGE